jgi:thymidylate kinase
VITQEISSPKPLAHLNGETSNGSRALAKHLATGAFLEEFFSQLAQAAVTYAVLRNYDGLPEMPGRDIDFLTTDYGRFVEILRRSSRNAGYSLRIFRRYDGMTKFHLVRCCPEFELLEIDVAWLIRWQGITFVSNKLLPSFRRPKRGFFTLSPGAEAFISLTKNLMYHGTIAEKYKPLLPDMAGSDRTGFIAASAECLGDSLAAKLFDLTCRGDWEGIVGLVPQLRRNAVSGALQHRPFDYLLGCLTYIYLNVLKFFRPSGKFLVILGPDGSGKSTISKQLQKVIEPLFQGSRYYHGHFMLIPRLKDIAKRLGFKTNPDIPAMRPDTQGPEETTFTCGVWRSWLYLIYYSLGYLLGHGVIFRARGRGELIIFDRYFYDYLIQPGLSVPRWLVRLILKMLPNPDLVIYLANDPQIIYSRKPELTLKEITRQNTVCANLIKRLQQGHVVKNTGTPAETAQKIAKILVDGMCGTVNPGSNPHIEKAPCRGL